MGCNAMATAVSSRDSESLVARIIAELRADPDAQALLLRALLTNEWLGMPIRLERMEADIAELNTRTKRMEADIAELNTRTKRMEADIAELNTRTKRVETDVAELKTRMTHVEADVAVLKGDSLEAKLHRRIRPLLSRRLGLRRTRPGAGAADGRRPERGLLAGYAGGRGRLSHPAARTAARGQGRSACPPRRR